MSKRDNEKKNSRKEENEETKARQKADKKIFQQRRKGEKKKVARNLVKLEEAISKGKEARNKQRNKEKANGKTKYRPHRLTEGSSQQGKAGRQNESRFQDDS